MWLVMISGIHKIEIIIFIIWINDIHLSITLLDIYNSTSLQAK